MHNTKISYIIVCWNNEEIIEKCILSLLEYENEYDNEIIIVDNNSNDKTCSIIKDKFKDKVILIESKFNNGFSKANNIGLKYATGEYIFYVNPDVIFIEDIVTPMIKLIKKKKDVGIVSPCLLYNDLTYQRSVANFPSIKKLIFDDLQIFRLLPDKYRKIVAQAQFEAKEDRYVDWTYGAAHFCHKNDVLTINGYPTDIFMYGEDTEFCKNMLEVAQKKTFYLGSVKLIHIGGFSESKVINSKKVVYVTRSNLKFIFRYHSKLYFVCYKVLYLFMAFLKYVMYEILFLFNNNLKYLNGKKKWNTTVKTILFDDDMIIENKIK